MKKLSGKTALITGGAGLLGVEHAKAILDAGGRAVLTDVNNEKLEKALSELGKFYGENLGQL